MRLIATALFLGLFVLAFLTAVGGKVGCSSSPAPPQADAGAAAQPTPSPKSQARRDVPPLYTPGTPPPKVKPMTLKDEKSGVLFYFESDGQHVTAIEPDGAVRWHKNPVEDAGLKGYSKDGQTSWPIIFSAGPPLAWMVEGKKGAYFAVSFSTKDFGLINKQTGEFTYLGRD